MCIIRSTLHNYYLNVILCHSSYCIYEAYTLSKKEQKRRTYVLNLMLSNKLRLAITAFKEIHTYF